MKKTLIVLSLATVFLFANGQTIQVSQMPTGCVESKLSERTSILSCPSGEFKISFNTYTNGQRNTSQEAIVDKIGEVKPIIIQQISNK